MSESRLTVAVSNDFFKALNGLPEKARGKVATFISNSGTTRAVQA